LKMHFLPLIFCSTTLCATALGKILFDCNDLFNFYKNMIEVSFTR
jgi:hypothetical protein